MNRSRRILSALGFALALGSTVPGCLVTATGQARFRTGAVVVYDEPPPPRVETVEYRSGYTFVRGHWEWQGGQWQWVPGYWERERTGYVWVDGYWERRGNSWHWISGRWSTNGSVAVEGGYQGRPQPVEQRPYEPAGRPQNVDQRETTVVHPRPNETVIVTQYPTQPPPPVRSESPGNRAGYVWIAGRWDWRAGNWEWIPGHWERARPQAVWQPGRWELRGNYYVWIEGQWSN